MLCPQATGAVCTCSMRPAQLISAGASTSGRAPRWCPLSPPLAPSSSYRDPRQPQTAGATAWGPQGGNAVQSSWYRNPVDPAGRLGRPRLQEGRLQQRGAQFLGPSFSCPAWFQGPPHSRAGVSLHPSLCKRGVRGQSWDPASLGTCWPQLFWALVSHLLSVEPAPGDGPAAASQQELFRGAHILRPPEGQPSF